MDEETTEHAKLPTVGPAASFSSTPILQWRKLSGDTKNKGVPWTSTKNNCSKDTQKCSRSGKLLKVSRQDSINAQARLKRKEIETASKKKAVHRDRKSNKKLHIVQSKKSQYTHLVSSQQVKAKDEDAEPIIYKSSKEERKEVAPLWLQPFTVVDDY